jgi:dihydroxynaphthoic acid synthetase
VSDAEALGDAVGEETARREIVDFSPPRKGKHEFADPSGERRSMSYKEILYEIEDGVATITINRPHVLNAFTGDTLAEMADAFRKIGKDSSAGVAVLTGAGERAFSAGGDVHWEAAGGLDRNAGAKQMMVLYEAMRESLKPCIARVNGYAIGGGNHLTYFCDLSIAADHAIFGQNGPRVASPAQGWIVSYSVRVLGAKRAREMWMLCRRYTAQQALQWGLVNAVVPMGQLDIEVRKWTSEILAMSPSCIKALKASFDDEYSVLRDLQGDRDYVSDINPGFWESGEQAEGAAAFLEKRPPNFDAWR